MSFVDKGSFIDIEIPAQKITGLITLEQLVSAVCSETELSDAIAAIPSDDVVATPSLRTLGTEAQQAAAGDHTHTLTVTQVLFVSDAISISSGLWIDRGDPEIIPANAKKVECFAAATVTNTSGDARILYNDVERCKAHATSMKIAIAMWTGDGVGSAAPIKVQGTGSVVFIAGGAWYTTIS